MEVIKEKNEQFRKIINDFNQNKFLKFKKATFKIVEKAIKEFETNHGKAKDVLNEFNSRYEEQLNKLMTTKRENEAKKNILRSEERFLNTLKENKLRTLQENIIKLSNDLQVENQELLQEEKQWMEKKNEVNEKLILLQGILENYQKNLGLFIEKSENNNLLVTFENLTHSSLQERLTIEIGPKQDDDEDFEIIKCYPNLGNLQEPLSNLNREKSFIKFLNRVREIYLGQKN